MLRTLSTSVPSVLYTAAQQAADFGFQPTAFNIIVYQVSATFGRGIGTRKTINA